MPWNDDSWRDSYDEWKLRSPYDEYDEPEPCDHEHYEIDICTGRAECDYCSKSWYLSAEEIDAELDRQANYQDEMDREGRRNRRRAFWRWLTYPIRWPIFRILEKVWPRKACSVLLDEEVPF